MDRSQFLKAKSNADIVDTNNETFFENGLPFFLNKEQFKNHMIDWISNIAAADLISTKNIDVFVRDTSFKLDRFKTEAYDQVLKNNYLELKIFEIAKKVSLTGIAGIWFMPRIPEQKDNKYSLNEDINIIQAQIINNELRKVRFLAKLNYGVAVGNIYAMVDADTEKYTTRFYNVPSGEDVQKLQKDEVLSKYEISEAEVLNKIDSLDNSKELIILMNKRHSLGFVPVICLFFNNEFIPTIRNYEQDLNELFIINQKMYDESNFMGSKVKWVNNGDIDSFSSKKELLKYVKVAASASGIYTNSPVLDGVTQNDVDIITKVPIYEQLFNAFKQRLNLLLKKLGLSSDTDSKGTVQQSIGEIIKQNEFSYNFQNYRNLVLQNFLQELLSKFYQANFGELKSHVKVVSTQSLGLNELEKLNYVIQAKSNNLINQVRGVSILTGKNYIDSLALCELQDLKEDEDENVAQPELINLGDEND